MNTTKTTKITRADKVRSFNDEELAFWLAKSQAFWLKEAHSALGDDDFKVTEDVIKIIADELLPWLQEAF